MDRVKVLAELFEHHSIEEKSEKAQELTVVSGFMKRGEKSPHQPLDDRNGVLRNTGEITSSPSLCA